MTDAIRTIGRVQWQATLLLAVVFGAGAAVGAAIDHTRVIAAAPAPAPAPPPPPAGGGRLPPYIERLTLTQDQHEKIRVILDAQRPKVDSAMNEILPRLRTISDTTFARIRAVLTAEQQKQFDSEKPVRALAPGMPGRGGEGATREGRSGEGRGGDGRRGPPPPRDGRGPPPDGRGPPPDGRGPPPPRDGRGPPPDGRGPPPRP